MPAAWWLMVVTDGMSPLLETHSKPLGPGPGSLCICKGETEARRLWPMLTELAT